MTRIAGAILALSLSAAAAPSTPGPSATPEANRRLVLDFWRVVIEARDIDRVADFLAVDMIQHNPNIADGSAGFLAFARSRWRDQPKLPAALRLRDPPVAVLADGDLVQLVFRRSAPDTDDPTRRYDRYLFDLYRVKDGKIVEHWDAVPKRADPRR